MNSKLELKKSINIAEEGRSRAPRPRPPASIDAACSSSSCSDFSSSSPLPQPKFNFFFLFYLIKQTRRALRSACHFPESAAADAEPPLPPALQHSTGTSFFTMFFSIFRRIVSLLEFILSSISPFNSKETHDLQDVLGFPVPASVKAQFKYKSQFRCLMPAQVRPPRVFRLFKQSNAFIVH